MSIEFDTPSWAQSSFAAGGLGAVLSLKFAPGSSWWERTVNVGAGLGMAIYLAPLLADWQRITSAGGQSGVAFAVGFLGLSVAAALLKGFRDTNWADIFTGWFGRKG